MFPVVKHPFGKHRRSVSVFLVTRETVKSRKSVGVSRDAVTDSIAFAQDAASPNDFAAFDGQLQIFGVAEHFVREKQRVDDARSSMAPMKQLVFGITLQGGGEISRVESEGKWTMDR